MDWSKEHAKLEIPFKIESLSIINFLIHNNVLYAPAPWTVRKGYIIELPFQCDKTLFALFASSHLL